MNRILKNVIGIIILGVVAYNSVYFKKLDEVKKGNGKNTLDAKVYANNFYQEKILKSTDKATAINELTDKLKANPDETFKQYAHSLGIGNIRYFLVKAMGKITKINENTLDFDVDGKSYSIATEFIFGNAVRDASGIITMTTFENTMDFNNVSAELNEIIRNKVVPDLKKKATLGRQISLFGAIELNQKHLKLNEIEIIPILVIENGFRK
jgi:predicted lipoprotein